MGRLARGQPCTTRRLAPPPGQCVAPISVPPDERTIAALVRRHDPDRFLTALFAPPEHRDALLTLYAFDHELARAREVTSEPHLALIRLHWWREVVEGARRRHEVATPLGELLDFGPTRRRDLLPVIEAYEMESEPCIETAGGLAGLAVARGWRDRCCSGPASGCGRSGDFPADRCRPWGRTRGPLESRAGAPRALSVAGRFFGRGRAHGACGDRRHPSRLIVAPVLRRLAEEGQRFLAKAPSRSDAARPGRGGSSGGARQARSAAWDTLPPGPRGLADRLPSSGRASPAGCESRAASGARASRSVPRSVMPRTEFSPGLTVDPPACRGSSASANVQGTRAQPDKPGPRPAGPGRTAGEARDDPHAGRQRPQTVLPWALRHTGGACTGPFACNFQVGAGCACSCSGRVKLTGSVMALRPRCVV